MQADDRRALRLRRLADGCRARPDDRPGRDRRHRRARRQPRARQGRRHRSSPTAIRSTRARAVERVFIEGQRVYDADGRAAQVLEPCSRHLDRASRSTIGPAPRSRASSPMTLRRRAEPGAAGRRGARDLRAEDPDGRLATGRRSSTTASLLVRDGLIEAVGPARSTAIPAGYDVRDVGERWLMPGMIDLHCHVGGDVRHQRHGAS